MVSQEDILVRKVLLPLIISDTIVAIIKIIKQNPKKCRKPILRKKNPFPI